MLLESKGLVGLVNDDTVETLKRCSFGGNRPYIIAFEFQSDNPYLKWVRNAADAVGIDVQERFLGVSTSPADLSKWTKTYSLDVRCVGFFIARPCPRWVLDWAYFNFPSRKDIDCVSLQNLLSIDGEPIRIPTVRAVESLLRYYQVPMESKSFVVVGRSREIGRPMADMLLSHDADVTVLHSHTKYLKTYILNAYGVVSCSGARDSIERGVVHNLSVAVDLDHDFTDDALGEVESHTPRFGGVGPLSIAYMLNNAAHCADRTFGFNHSFKG